MPRLLLRASKDPWTPVPPEAVLTQDTLPGNVGNLLFGQSVYRTLSVPGTEIVPNNFLSSRPGVDDAYVQQINEGFDGFVLPLANAFRPSFQSKLRRLTRVISKLDIPITVVGVGSQHRLELSDGGSDPIADDVKDFMSAVLDRSATVGVRGELTAAYLKGLGFGDEHVDVIGCPSIFMNGPSPTVTRKVSGLNADSHVALTLTPYVKQMAGIAEHNVEKYRNLIYIPQDAADLNTMVWGEDPRDIADLRMPVHTGHRLYTEDRMRFPLDPRTWVEYLQDFDFTFGTRMHGTIASIHAGVPGMLLAHDSRTLELAEYFDIPHRLITEVDPQVDAAELYESADYSKFHAGLPEKFERFTAFLERNALPHIYQEGNANPAFDDKLAEADLPPIVHPLTVPGEAGQREMAARLRWLRQGKAVDKARTKYQLKPALPHTTKSTPTLKKIDKDIQGIGRNIRGIDRKATESSREVEELKAQLAKTRKELARQAKVIRRLSRPKPTALQRGRKFAGRAKRSIKRRLRS
ncbi:polysaccharide pyruvyl transferase family protein [Arthrobacter pigmenti]